MQAVVRSTAMHHHRLTSQRQLRLAPRALRAAAPLAPPRPRRSAGVAAPSGGVRVLAASGSGPRDTPDIDVDALLAKYGGGAATPQPQPAAQQPARRAAAAPQKRPAAAGAQPIAAPPGNGVFLLLLINIGLFVADHVLRLPLGSLYLNHAHPQWWQWVTHAFCHANFGHLSGNLFNLCVFGKLVEETEGAFGLVFTYLACALGAAAVSVFTQPAIVHGAVSVSLGASGAIFGLFMVSVLARISWDPRRLLEGLILGWFVVRQVVGEAAAQASGGLSIGGLAVGHIAHLGGALAGVLLVLALKSVPDPDA
ncbi:hypothetical protein Rsub_06351 [Raphidocelis subcapitata]|uniref:Peptidase S54 rhomboid domain-containing protein n=1 Tax=Raphidocelis subcapitata TaxID=307507 RepID=A0A2V0P223_9CHLO|nr:hypothetical protein Rsub_06351 [Raphidocelis subcapitata]|eukprot:GBF93629.1 hypothetical protein Rsub_06351 [Raphidocelis subcapitata]